MDMYLQIEGNEPFVPDRIVAVGPLVGMRETTKPGDIVISFCVSSMVYRASYVKDGLSFSDFYRSGEWLVFNGLPLFKVDGILNPL